MVKAPTISTSPSEVPIVNGRIIPTSGGPFQKSIVALKEPFIEVNYLNEKLRSNRVSFFQEVKEYEGEEKGAEPAESDFNKAPTPLTFFPQDYDHLTLTKVWTTRKVTSKITYIKKAVGNSKYSRQTT